MHDSHTSRDKVIRIVGTTYLWSRGRQRSFPRDQPLLHPCVSHQFRQGAGVAVHHHATASDPVLIVTTSSSNM